MVVEVVGGGSAQLAQSLLESRRRDGTRASLGVTRVTGRMSHVRGPVWRGSRSGWHCVAPSSVAQQAGADVRKGAWEIVLTQDLELETGDEPVVESRVGFVTPLNILARRVGRQHRPAEHHHARRGHGRAARAAD